VRGYAICTSPRSGSNYLCQLLTSTGVLGAPLEYFNGASRRVLEDPTYPDDPTQQIARILSAGATENGVYALKMFPDQFAAISRHVRLTDALPGLQYVRLRRRDTLGQALSWARALQTEQYRSTQASKGEPKYDGKLIIDRLSTIARSEASWDFYFGRAGLQTLSLVYEDIDAAPQKAVDSIATQLDLAVPSILDPAAINVDIQRDVITEVWRARFLKEFGDPNVIHRL
jgi:trehalose 2-sulfotransferase